jgi:hypothetical protein
VHGGVRVQSRGNVDAGSLFVAGSVVAHSVRVSVSRLSLSTSIKQRDHWNAHSSTCNCPSPLGWKFNSEGGALWDDRWLLAIIELFSSGGLIYFHTCIDFHPNTT